MYQKSAFRGLVACGVLICAGATARGLAVRSLAPAADAVAMTVHGTAHVGSRPQPNVAVWLEPTDGTKVPASQPKKAVLDQRNLNFYPSVLVVRVGTTVDLPNNDRVFHNVFSFHNGKRFDLGLYPVGTVRTVTFDQPGLSRIFCNIHPNMAAYVMAVDSPYFSLSDDKGQFEIDAVPPGRYTYHAWRSGGPELSGSTEPAASGGPSLELRWP